MNNKDKLKKHSRIRLFIQFVFAVLINGYLTGYAKGTIFTGKTKIACVPVLNCYSCPGASMNYSNKVNHSINNNAITTFIN